MQVFIQNMQNINTMDMYVLISYLVSLNIQNFLSQICSTKPHTLDKN